MAINRIRRITVSTPSIKEDDYYCEEYLTDDDRVRVLEVKFPDGSKRETTYNPHETAYRKAVDAFIYSVIDTAE